MRPGLIAAALLALPGAALADEGTPVGTTGGGFDLQAGHDYALIGISDAPDTVDLLDPGGNVVASVATISDLEHGAEFRARYSARYFLRDHDTSAGLSAAVVPDCPGNASTRCPISINHTKSGQLPWPDDQDWRAIKLAGGRAYVVTVDGDSNACAYVVDPAGKRSAGCASAGAPMTYRAAAAGAYHLAMVDGDVAEGADYSVVVRAR